MRGAIIPISAVARAVGVSRKTMKRRLKKLDERMGGGLLVRPSGASGAGWLYADLDALDRLAIMPRERRRPAATEDGSGGATQAVEDLTAMITVKLTEIENAVLSIRDAVAEKFV